VRERDRMHLARYYQALLESGKSESRTALARHLRVSRASVFWVLNRIKVAIESCISFCGHQSFYLLTATLADGWFGSRFASVQVPSVPDS
jgi:hypothetical protein